MNSKSTTRFFIRVWHEKANTSGPQKCRIEGCEHEILKVVIPGLKVTSKSSLGSFHAKFKTYIIYFSSIVKEVIKITTTTHFFLLIRPATNQMHQPLSQCNNKGKILKWYCLHTHTVD